MKARVWAFPLVFTVAGWCVSGCAHKPAYVEPAGAVRVSTRPPSHAHLAGVPPGTQLHWVEGHWTYTDSHWVWVPGYWAEYLPPGS